MSKQEALQVKRTGTQHAAVAGRSLTLGSCEGEVRWDVRGITLLFSDVFPLATNFFSSGRRQASCRDTPDIRGPVDMSAPI